MWLSVIVPFIDAFDFESLTVPASSEFYIRRTIP